MLIAKQSRARKGAVESGADPSNYRALAWH